MDTPFYEGVAAELASKLRRIKSFTTHAPSLGAHHEQALRTVLTPLLSSRFSMRSGFVYDNATGASRQGDILIVDEHHANAYFYREGDFAIVEHSAVACVVEVKTRLTMRAFLDGVSNLASFRRVTQAKHDPFTLLFAFESEPWTPKRLDTWYRSVSLSHEPISYPYAVCALDRGILILRKASDGEWGHQLSMERGSEKHKHRSLSIFFQTVRKSLLEQARIDGNPFEYALLDGLTWSKEFMRFGQGVVAPRAA